MRSRYLNPHSICTYIFARQNKCTDLFINTVNANHNRYINSNQNEDENLNGKVKWGELVKTLRRRERRSERERERKSDGGVGKGAKIKIGKMWILWRPLSEAYDFVICFLCYYCFGNILYVCESKSRVKKMMIERAIFKTKNLLTSTKEISPRRLRLNCLQ